MFLSFSDSSVGKESACNAGDPQFDSWVGKIHWKRDRLPTPVFLVFPGGSAAKEYACNAGDLGLIPGLGRCPGEGKGYPLQYCDLENSMNCIVHGGHKDSDMTERLSCSRFSAGSIFPPVTQYPLFLPLFLFLSISLIPHGGPSHTKYFPNQTWFQHMRVSGAHC